MPKFRKKPVKETCKCCYGKGVVYNIDGILRPCSRCRAEAFNEWSIRLIAEQSNAVEDNPNA